MEKATNHLLSLINDVLQMSKLEDGREELSSELVCLPDVFYDMKAIIDGSALDKMCIRDSYKPCIRCGRDSTEDS